MADKIATHMFVAEVDGRTVVVLPGARFKSTHSVVKDNPGHFQPAKAKRRTS